MTRHPISLRVEDLTDFTRALSRQLGEASPSHLTLMNMVARAAGFQNVQHCRAASKPLSLESSQEEEQPIDARCVTRALRLFDESARLQQWPTRRAVQALVLWGLWSTLPAGRTLQEKDINRLLNAEHAFDDPATLRRTLIANGLLSRESNGSNYRRVEQQPGTDARVVIRHLRDRRESRPQPPTSRHESPLDQRPPRAL